MGLFDGILDVVGTATTGVPWGSVIQGGASLIGGVMTNQSNAQQAQMNRDFQAGQSATSYQRAVADMQAAGLSPMLAYSQGGASTPTGAFAQMQNPVPNAVSAYQESKMNSQNIENLKAQELKTKADTLASIETAKNVAAQAKKTALETEYMPVRLAYELSNMATQNRLNSATAANTERGIAPSTDPFGIREPVRKVIGNVLDPISSAIQGLRNFGGKLHDYQDRLFRKGK